MSNAAYHNIDFDVSAAGATHALDDIESIQSVEDQVVDVQRKIRSC